MTLLARRGAIAVQSTIGLLSEDFAAPGLTLTTRFALPPPWSWSAAPLSYGWFVPAADNSTR